MTKVVPAIQPKSIEEYSEKLRLVRQLTSRFQLDIVSADFNDTPTIALSEIVTTGGLICDVHIMARDPRPQILQAKKLHPQLVILQYEGVEEIDTILESLRSTGQRVGVAINPETSVEEIARLLPMLDHLLIMAYPAGPSGQTLRPGVLQKVKKVREIKQSIEVGLDGGAAEETLQRIAKADFDIVNVTTYLFGAEDPLNRYTELMGALV